MKKLSVVSYQVSAVLILLPWSSMGSFDVPARPAPEIYPPISIRWNNPLHQFPILGFHMAVDMEKSTLDVDRVLRARPFATYNCHHYTKTFIEGSDASLADIESINDLYLAQKGYHQSSGAARVGDIVVAVKRPESLDESSVFTHSGVVMAVDDQGRILTIRQKFNASEPVVDLALDEFISLYADQHPWEWHVWSRRG